MDRDHDEASVKTVQIVKNPVAPSYERLGRVSLKVLDGPETNRIIHAEVSPTRVLRGGRNAKNDIVLNDEAVSGFHFTLEFATDGIVLRDPGSCNGVFVEGLRVRDAVIQFDTVFRVGATSLQLTAADTVRIPLSPRDHYGAMYGFSPIMRELFARLERVPPTSVQPVLITGETGTGKELVARGIHDHSARAHQPFVVLDCTAVPEGVAEMIVFGHAKGAFAGAVCEHAGVFEQADGGTLFIDELGEFPLALQPKLLRALDGQGVRRFNEPRRVRQVDVRIICATNCDLERMVDEHRFREDLYYRIHGLHIRLPTLRDRGDDVVLLAERFLLAACARTGRPPATLTTAARAALRAASWPGNVRQLKKVVEAALEQSAGASIDEPDLYIGRGAASRRDRFDNDSLMTMPWPEAGVAFQREYLKALLQRVGTARGWINNAAKLAGMDRGGLVKALKRLELYHDSMDEGPGPPAKPNPPRPRPR